MQVRKLQLAGTHHDWKMYEQDDFVVRDFDSGWEYNTLRLWYTELTATYPTHQIILDIGAYSGIYTLLSNAWSLAAEIHAFEPVPPVYERLKANVALNAQEVGDGHYVSIGPSNNQIHVHNIALSDEDKDLKINITGGSPLPSGSSFDPHATRQTIRQYDVQCRTGDSFMAELDSTKMVALVKIDVEHHEYAVVKGLEKTLKKHFPVIFIELLSLDEFTKVKELLFEYGYNYIEQIDDLSREFTPTEDVTDTTPSLGTVDGARNANFVFMRRR